MKTIRALVLSIMLMVMGMTSVYRTVHASGTGTEEDPYIITTPQELQNIALDLDAHYVLGNDLDMQDVVWVSIGSLADPFVGELDGNGHEITNLELTFSQANYLNSTVLVAGMFGFIGPEAQIENLGLDYSLIASEVESEGTNLMIGGLAAHVDMGYDGTINDVWVSAHVELASSGSMESLMLGGVLGQAYNVGSMYRISFTGSLSVEAENTTVSMGGIVGYGVDIALMSSLVFDAVISTGKSLTDGDSCIGGMIGSLNYFDGSRTDESKFNSNVVSDTVIHGGNRVYAGGLAGFVYQDDLGQRIEKTLVAHTEVVGGRGIGGLVGLSFFTKYFNNEISSVSVSISEDYVIDAEDWVIGSGGFIGFSYSDIVEYLVLSNVDVGLGKSVSNVGGIAGSAEGTDIDTVEITGIIHADGHNVGGAVGYTMGVALLNVIIEAQVTGNYHVGGIVGYSGGPDYLQSCSYNGSLSGEVFVGGLVGRQEGNSLNIVGAIARGDYEANNLLGGLLGYSTKTVVIAGAYFAGTLKLINALSATGPIDEEMIPVGSVQCADPIICSTVNVYLTSVYYDNERYTGTSLFEGIGFSSAEFKRSNSELAITLGGVDERLVHEHEFFVSPLVNDGYISLYAQRATVEFIVDGEVVAVQLTGFHFVKEEVETGNPKIVQIYHWWRLIEPIRVNREGFRFVGWSSDEAGEEMIDLVGPFYGDMILYAQWEEELPDTGEASNLGLLWLSLGLLGLMISRKRKA